MPYRKSIHLSTLVITALFYLPVEARYLSPSVEFDASSTVLPRNFEGHDVLGLMSGLSKVNGLQRDEYETSVAFKQRKDAAAEKALGVLANGKPFAIVVRNSPFVRINPDGSLTFKPGKNAAAPLSSRFNADTETVYVTARIDRTLCREDRNQPSTFLTLSEINSPRVTYVGSNAYGATRDVEKYSITREGVRVFRLPLQGKEGFDNDGFSFSFSASAKVAKELRTRLSVLLIARPVTTDVAECTYYESPKLDSLYDVTAEYRSMEIKVYQAWLFDQSTGKVLQKLNFEAPSAE